ncbi:MAG: NADH-ubiquinone oxidoreductase subunit NDUFA12 family protein [Rickettsiales bacterium]
MTIATRIYTRLCGKKKGSDALGNVYFENGKKRWVLYAKGNDASSVCPTWFGWLHHTTDDVAPQPYAWQCEHEPNHTGTQYAYRPPGRREAPSERPAPIKYGPWTPPSA